MTAIGLAPTVRGMRLLAPAKINLHLRVGPRRADGFHPLLTWMTTVGLFDNLELEEEGPTEAPGLRGGRAEGGNEGGARDRESPQAAPVALQCDLPGLPCDERNLVVRIALAFRDAVRSEGSAPSAPREEDSPGTSQPCAAAGASHVCWIRATLHKRIPVGAGLGGGSSDAARMLMGLNRLWNTGRAADDLSAFAARFGSDLPFFFHGPSSECRGRGEIVRPVAIPAPRWAVLVLPALSMPTADVYRRFDAMRLGREQDIESSPDYGRWAKLKSEDLLPHLVNDLEAPAFGLAPQLAQLRERIERALGRMVRMSGSGSSLFTLFDAWPEALAAAEQIERDISERGLAVEVCPNIRDDLNEAFIRK